MQQGNFLQGKDRLSRYQELLEQAGISEQAMAEHLAAQGIGSPEQWRKAIARGDTSMFSRADAENARAFIGSNPQLVEKVRQVVGM